MLNYKNLYIILLIQVFIGSCGKESNKITEEVIKTKIDTSFSETEELNGIWGMTSYFDSIVTNKKVADYRIQQATWFAFLIEIRSDSIFNYGSINDGKVERFDSDTLAQFESMHGKWSLIQRNPKLILVNTFQEYGDIDSNKYVFRKRDDLAFLTENLTEKRTKLDSNISDYFNKKLLSGQYLLGKEKVVFFNNGRISGLKEYTNYKTRNYFGTLHPFNEMDVVYFSNQELKDYWSWEFSGQNLILTKLKPDWAKTDKYWPTEKQIILVKN